MSKSLITKPEILRLCVQREQQLLLVSTPFHFPERVIGPQLSHSWFFGEWLVNQSLGFELLTRFTNTKEDWIAVCFADDNHWRISLNQFRDGQDWQDWVRHSQEWSFVAVTFIYCLTQNVVLYSFFDCPSILSSDKPLEFSELVKGAIFTNEAFIDECVGNYFVGLSERQSMARAETALKNYHLI